jgi:hypothetical protein
VLRGWVKLKPLKCQKKKKSVIREDGRVEENDMAAILDVSHCSVQHVTHNVLLFPKVSARWVPKQGTPELKKRGVWTTARNFCEDTYTASFRTEFIKMWRNIKLQVLCAGCSILGCNTVTCRWIPTSRRNTPSSASGTKRRHPPTSRHNPKRHKLTTRHRENIEFFIVTSFSPNKLMRTSTVKCQDWMTCSGMLFVPRSMRKSWISA